MVFVFFNVFILIWLLIWVIIFGVDLVVNLNKYCLFGISGFLDIYIRWVLNCVLSSGKLFDFIIILLWEMLILFFSVNVIVWGI